MKCSRNREDIVQPEIMEKTFSSVNLERKGNLKQSLLFISSFLILEILKQTLNYEMATKNGGKYPLPTPLLLASIEIIKLSGVSFFILITGQSFSNFQPSLRFAIPSLCYLLTNLMYLHALQHIAPPVWMVLIQTRTIYTATVYKIVFGRSVTPLQMMGCILIVLSIPTAKCSDLLFSHQPTGVTPYILVLSQASAFLSTVAAVTVELLLKNDRRSFGEQQVWLYLWGILYALLSIPLLISSDTLKEELLSLDGVDWALVCMGVLTMAAAGLCVPFIVKNLDTIVKDYLSAANNILLSAVTALVFPKLFSLSLPFVGSLAILFAGIVLYERFAAVRSKKSLPITKIETT